MSNQDQEQKEWEGLRLKRGQEVLMLMAERNITSDEVKPVIYDAESTGQKLYQPDSDRLLAKKVIGNVTYYVEYSPAEEDAYTVHTTYFHKTTLL